MTAIISLIRADSSTEKPRTVALKQCFLKYPPIYQIMIISSTDFLRFVFLDFRTCNGRGMNEWEEFSPYLLLSFLKPLNARTTQRWLWRLSVSLPSRWSSFFCL